MQMQLKGYIFDIVDIRHDANVSADVSAETRSADVLTNVSLGKKEDEPNLYLVGLDIEVKSSVDRPMPYQVHVSTRGIFETDPSIDKAADLTGWLGNVAPSILYSAAREMVASITSRGAFGPLYLPLASFKLPREFIQEALGETPQGDSPSESSTPSG